MSLIDGPDVAGILDALGRHDAAETLRWSETAHPHADCETEIAGLTDELAETIREMECAQEDLGKAKALLAKYIDHVGQEEGTTFLAHRPADRFTDSEWAELLEAEKKK